VIFGYSFEVYKPDGIFICAQNDWVYLTAIWKGYESDFDDATEWQLLYIHRLEGPITHISSYYHENYQFTPNHDFDENNALAVLYQKQEQEQIQYVLRLYNIGKFESGSSDFDYVGKNPDNAKFRTIQIPRNIFEIGKRKDEALVVKSSESGPTQSVIRVMNAEITADEESWTFQVMVIHNSSSSDDANPKQDSYSKEAYIVRSEYLPVLEESPFQVVGAEVNANGNILLLVTQ
ncbi:14288_t:CDS:2, partial [Racocetra fulgida]